MILNKPFKSTVLNKEITYVFIVMALLHSLLVPASEVGAVSDSCGISVHVTPAAIPPGGISLVHIAAPAGASVVKVRFLDRNLPVFRNDNGNWFALAGAGLKASPGRHSLTVQWKHDGNTDVFAADLKIEKKKYPEEHLKVAKKMVDFPPDILKRVLADQKAVRGVCSHITAERYWKGPFLWPVNSKILSPFGLRRFFNGQPRSPHSGVDLRAKDGAPIIAPNNGRIVLVRDCYLSGNTLVIDHGAGLYTLYAHLSRFNVSRGAAVKKGQVIGLAGSTGRVTGPHLHWGVSLIGTRIDPQQFMTLAENYFSRL